MKEAIGKLPVIGEQKKSFGVVVEAADRKNPYAEIGEKIQDSPAAPGIGCGGYATGGLIEGENNALGLERNGLSVEANAVRQRIDAAAEFGPLTVHLNPALPDQFLGGASRSDSSPREKFLKPHHIKGA
jgi:hypothetical protein